MNTSPIDAAIAIQLPSLAAQPRELYPSTATFVSQVCISEFQSLIAEYNQRSNPQDRLEFLKSSVFKGKSIILMVPMEDRSVQTEVKDIQQNPIEILEKDTNEEFRANVDYILKAMKINLAALKYLSSNHRYNVRTLCKILEAYPTAAIDCVLDWIDNYRETAKSLCEAILIKIKSIYQDEDFDQPYAAKLLLVVMKIGNKFIGRMEFPDNYSEVREVLLKKLGYAPNLITPLVEFDPAVIEFVSNDCLEDQKFMREVIGLHSKCAKELECEDVQFNLDLLNDKKTQFEKTLLDSTLNRDANIEKAFNEFVQLFRILIRSRSKITIDKAAARPILTDVIEKLVSLNKNELVLKALGKNSFVPKTLSSSLLNDFDFMVNVCCSSEIPNATVKKVLSACNQNIDNKLMGNIEFWQKALKLNDKFSDGDDLKDNKETLKPDYKFFSFASDDLKNNKDAIKLLVKDHEPILEHCELLTRDSAFILELSEINPKALYYCRGETPRSFWEKAFKITPRAHLIMVKHFDIEDDIFELIKLSPLIAKSISQKLLGSEGFVMKVIGINPKSAQYFDLRVIKKDLADKIEAVRKSLNDDCLDDDE